MTRRTILEPMPPPLMRALLRDDWKAAADHLGAEIPEVWTSGHWHWLGDRPDRGDADPSLVDWFPRVMMLREADGRARRIIDEGGFHGPPDDDGRVELGYMIVPAFRRRGFAEEAVRSLMAWATSEKGITGFRASIEPENLPSLNLVRKLGFGEAESYLHEQLGNLLIFQWDGGPLAARL